MEQLQPQKVKEFQQKILSWYAQNKRDLPWRKTRDPYKILVSEVMLQQTQVQRVIPKYEAWFMAFPTVEDLAKASTSHVLRAWSGLGYNRRALYLQKIAKILVEKYSSSKQIASRRRFWTSQNDGIIHWPQDEKILRTLPGIGEYTARAVLCFAFDKQVAVVDTNIRKVILLTFLNRHSGKSKTHPESIRQAMGRSDSGQVVDARTGARMTAKETQEIADQLLPQGRAAEWNQALMDYAAAMLKQEKIPIPKQSRFVGSDRYDRGQIVKMLLEIKKLEIEKLRELVGCDFERFHKIIDKLVADGLLLKKGKSVMVAD